MMSLTDNVDTKISIPAPRPAQDPYLSSGNYVLRAKRSQKSVPAMNFSEHHLH